LIDWPSGLLVPVKLSVLVDGFLILFRNSALFAVNTCTRPSRADAWPPAEAKFGGIASVSPRGSTERNDPGNSSVLASVSPKFELLPTRMRTGSRTCPGCVNAANVGLSWIGPPGRNWPTALIAEAPGIPTATIRPFDVYQPVCADCIAAIRSSICRVRCGVMPSIRSTTINCPR
jgi:hypothetical protein